MVLLLPKAILHDKKTTLTVVLIVNIRNTSIYPRSFAIKRDERFVIVE